MPVEVAEGCGSLDKLRGLKRGLWEADEDDFPLGFSLQSFQDTLFLFFSLQSHLSLTDHLRSITEKCLER